LETFIFTSKITTVLQEEEDEEEVVEDNSSHDFLSVPLKGISKEDKKRNGLIS